MMELVKRCRRGHRYKLNNEAIKKLVNAEVRDMKVAVISVFGKGSGKIFDLFLKYANHRYNQRRSANDDWLAEAIDLTKDSVVRTARKIMIWPELFITKTRKYGKVAILLMGSQGILSFEEEAGTFAINVLTSSCQVFYVNRRISEEQLKHIETFTDFAKRLQDPGEINKAFQQLLFVVRGWENPTQYDYGFEGGHRYLIESVIHEARLAPDRLKTRQNVMSCFDEMKCFLMDDDIGAGIWSTYTSTQRFSESSSSNMEHYRIFAQTILAPDNLIFKRINGEFVTVERLLRCLKNWVNSLNAATLPDVNSMYRPTLQANNLILRKQAMRLYTAKMIELGSESPNYVDRLTLVSWHDEAKVIAMNYFEDKYEYDAAISEVYKKMLNNGIDEKFAGIRAKNDMKYKPFASLVLMPLLSAALITYSYCTLKTQVNDKPISTFISLTGFMAFWLSAMVLFRWSYLIYQTALSSFTNNVIIQIVVWTGAIIYGGIRLYMYFYPKKPKRWYW